MTGLHLILFIPTATIIMSVPAWILSEQRLRWSPISSCVLLRSLSSSEPRVSALPGQSVSHLYIYLPQAFTCKCLRGHFYISNTQCSAQLILHAKKKRQVLFYAGKSDAYINLYKKKKGKNKSRHEMNSQRTRNLRHLILEQTSGLLLPRERQSDLCHLYYFCNQHVKCIF